MKRLLFLLLLVVAGCNKNAPIIPVTPIDKAVKDSVILPKPPPTSPDSTVIVIDTPVTNPPAPPDSVPVITPPVEPPVILPPTPVEPPPIPTTPPPVVPAPNAWFFGDSITEGYDGTSVNPKNWTALLSAAMGWEGHNLGIGGSTLEKNGNGISAAKNMYNRIAEIPAKQQTDKYLFFAYGINDVAYNFFDQTATQFEADYQYVLDAAQSKGWHASDIVIVNIYYCREELLFKYTDPKGTAGGRLALFNNTIKNLAERNSTHLIDVYAYMQANGLNALVAADGVHPNAYGYSVIARGMEAAVKSF